MSDRFDITLERKLESSADRGDERVAGVRRIEVITGAERRRRWSEADKVRIVVESFRPGANVSEVARLNGLSPQQLFAWRREARALLREGGVTADASPSVQSGSKPSRARPQAAADDAPAFAPVVLAAYPPSQPPPGPPSPASQPAMIEIAIADMVVRVLGEVETATLVAVLRAVRRAS